MCLVLLFVLLASRVFADPVSGLRPNILLILADDLGWSDTGVSGSRFYRTPSIDSIAQAGMRFTQAYAASPLCSPTRASLLTGLNPARLRMTAAHAHLPEDVLSPDMPGEADPSQPVIAPPSATRLDPSLPVLPRLLRDIGYRTALFGKWHVGAGDYMPQRYGFDLSVPNSIDPLPRGYLAPWGTSGLPDDRPRGEHIDHYLARRVANFIGETKAQPWFVAFWPFSVHFPYQAKRGRIRYYEKVVDGTNSQQNPVMAAMIESLDESVGVVLEAVGRSEAADNTLVIFLSDNGGVDWMPAGKYPAMATNNYPLRGGKAQVYEGGLRVPMYLQWPAVIAAGQVSDALVSSEDILPTLLEAVGAGKPEGSLDGVSFMSQLRGAGGGKRDSLLAHLPHYIEQLQASPVTSLRRGPWKLIRHYEQGTPAGDRYELFNLDYDLSEQSNLVSAYPGIVLQMGREMQRLLDDMDALVPLPNPAYQAGGDN